MSFVPPRLAERLLRWTLPADDAEVVAGDLEELARRTIVPAAGARAARRWYYGQVLSIVAAHLLQKRAQFAGAPPQRTTMAIRQDVSYAVRSLRKSRGFTLTAVALLAVGLGATTTMFGLAHAVILKPLPYADPDRLMFVHLLAPRREGPASGRTIWSYPKYLLFRAHQRAFESVAAFGSWNWNITGSDAPERIDGELVAAAYFQVLGMHTHLGRTFSVDETSSPGSPRLVVLSHRLWMDRFGGDAGVLGRSLGLNGAAHTILGVMPAGFRGLTGQADLWVPITTLAAADLAEQWNHSYYVVARRKADVTAAQAIADASAMGVVIHEQIPDPGGKPDPWGATAVPLEEERVDPLIRRSIWLLLAAVVVVLAIVCINLGHLTLARGLARQREIAIRIALGAGRTRILRQFVTESALLAVAGAVAAVAVAATFLAASAALIPDLRTILPRGPAASGLTRVGFARLGLDATTLLFTLLAGAGAATAFGLLPAWRASRRDPTDTIKMGSGAGSGARRRGVSGRQVLIAGQVALAVVLLAAAGLMLKSVARLQAVDLGFGPASVVSLRFVLPGPQYSGFRANQLIEQLLAKLAARHEFDSVAYGSCAPVQGGCNATTASFPDVQTAPGGAEPVVGVLWASPTYFDTLAIRLLRGRTFTEHDRVGQPKVVIVNESAARRFWLGSDPIGRRIAVGQGGFGDGAEVVGVVADVPYGAVDQPVRPDVYLPLRQSRRALGVIFAKSRADTASIVSIVRSDLRALDPDLPLTDIRTMVERVGEATWRTRASAWLLGAFAAIALCLVAVGIYAVVSQSVEQRTREIGVRLAIGATRRDVLQLIIRGVIVVTVLGIAFGIALAVPAATLLTTLLYEVRPADPSVLASLAILLLGVALLAGFVPARRATRLDPLTTLRAE